MDVLAGGSAADDRAARDRAAYDRAASDTGCNILRIGAYELLWREQVPDAVAISEAVAMAGELSTDDSPAFVNGLLGRLLQLKPTLAL